MSTMYTVNLTLSLFCLLLVGVSSFAPTNNSLVYSFQKSPIALLHAEGVNGSNDASDIVGKRIIVKGDVNGGYVRTCIHNEASKFRRLIGTMSPPDDSSDTAEIYVEGKRKMVEGFLRWCSKGSKNVGLSQKLEVVSVTDETPTGLYDNFYVKTIQNN